MFRRRHQQLQIKPARRPWFRDRASKKQTILLPPTLTRNPVVRPQRPFTGHQTTRTINRAPAIKRRNVALALSNAVLAFGIALFWPAAMGTVDHSRNQIWGLDQTGVKIALAEYFRRDERPDTLALPNIPQKTGQIHYHIDQDLQLAVEKELEKHRPDFGMVVAMDAETGRILAMADSRRDGSQHSNMNLKATYPAASVFKTVTAAAAIDLGKVNANTVLPYNGKSTTLYKKHVLNHNNNKWTRHESLQKSFSKSVNTVFARLGVYTVGGDQLLEYADRFAFNQPVGSDLPLEPSTTEMNPEESWSVAETASGYTRGTNISPVHGAMLAATIVNDGRMATPRIIDAVTDGNGIILYESEPGQDRRVIKPETAGEMRKLMRQTVKTGSASKHFRRLDKRLKSLEVGGKTGSLTGFHPKGKYDWFIGYASDGDRKLAFAVLCINQDFWYVKSAFLARRLIENYFS